MINQIKDFVKTEVYLDVTELIENDIDDVISNRSSNIFDVDDIIDSEGNVIEYYSAMAISNILASELKLYGENISKINDDYSIWFRGVIGQEIWEDSVIIKAYNKKRDIIKDRFVGNIPKDCVITLSDGTEYFAEICEDLEYVRYIPKHKHTNDVNINDVGLSQVMYSDNSEEYIDICGENVWIDSSAMIFKN